MWMHTWGGFDVQPRKQMFIKRPIGEIELLLQEIRKKAPPEFRGSELKNSPDAAFYHDIVARMDADNLLKWAERTATQQFDEAGLYAQNHDVEWFDRNRRYWANEAQMAQMSENCARFAYALWHLGQY